MSTSPLVEGAGWILQAIQDAAEERAAEALVEDAKVEVEVQRRTKELRISVRFAEDWYLHINEADVLAYVAKDLREVSAPGYSSDPDEAAATRDKYAAAFHRLAIRIAALPLPERRSPTPGDGRGSPNNT